MRSVRYEIEDMVWYDEQDRVACLIEEEVGTRVAGLIWRRIEDQVAGRVKHRVTDEVKDRA